MNVKLMRMWSGEDVVADLIEEKDDSVVICNPIVAVPAGNGQMGFAPWSPLLKGKMRNLKLLKSILSILQIRKIRLKSSIKVCSLSFRHLIRNWYYENKTKSTS